MFQPSQSDLWKMGNLTGSITMQEKYKKNVRHLQEIVTRIPSPPLQTFKEKLQKGTW